MISLPFIRQFVALLATATLSACIADATVVDRHVTAAQAADKAIVIVSVSHDRSLRGAYARFFIDGGTPDAVKIESAGSPYELPIKNQFHDRYGHVYVLELAPGHHRFTEWQAHWRNFHTRRAEGADWLPLDFDVARGDVVYIGNLHANWVIGKALLGNRVPYFASVTVKDNSKEDIAIAEHTTPAIAGRARAALLPLGPWTKAPADSMAGDEAAVPPGADQMPGN
jgi:hypothetical protein